jgi:Raf kinase inhibitor-like YbhB/YbcL family protein
MIMRLLAALAALALFAGCDRGGGERSPVPKGDAAHMKITSTAFEHEAMIPSKYTCDGQDISHDLSWTGVPEGAKSLVLINDDPDAPVGLWVHWVLYNIPPHSTGLPEGVDKKTPSLPDGSVQGTNSWGRTGYGGPCPPGGTHRYFFKLYALDTVLDLPPGAKKDAVEKAMKGHVLAEAVLMGRYARK